MTFVVQRRGDDYTISVTTSAMGEKVVHTHTTAGDIQGLGLRPWRGTIRLYEWTVTAGSSVDGCALYIAGPVVASRGNQVATVDSLQDLSLIHI